MIMYRVDLGIHWQMNLQESVVCLQNGMEYCISPQIVYSLLMCGDMGEVGRCHVE